MGKAWRENFDPMLHPRPFDQLKFEIPPKNRMGKKKSRRTLHPIRSTKATEGFGAIIQRVQKDFFEKKR
jgi:hypothetical protein